MLSLKTWVCRCFSLLDWSSCMVGIDGSTRFDSMIQLIAAVHIKKSPIALLLIFIRWLQTTDGKNMMLTMCSLQEEVLRFKLSSRLWHWTPWSFSTHLFRGFVEIKAFAGHGTVEEAVMSNSWWEFLLDVRIRILHSAPAEAVIHYGETDETTAFLSNNSIWIRTFFSLR